MLLNLILPYNFAKFCQLFQKLFRDKNSVLWDLSTWRLPSHSALLLAWPPCWPHGWAGLPPCWCITPLASTQLHTPPSWRHWNLKNNLGIWYWWDAGLSLFSSSVLRIFNTLFQERAVFGKMKMDPAKRAQTQNAGEVSSLQWFFSQSVEMMTDKVWLHCIRPMLLK